MATRTAHLVIDSQGKTVGIVVDAAELAALQTGTLPEGTFLREVTAVRDDGSWYVVGAPVETFTVAKEGSRRAAKIAALAKLAPEELILLGLV